MLTSEALKVFLIDAVMTESVILVFSGFFLQTSMKITTYLIYLFFLLFGYFVLYLVNFFLIYRTTNKTSHLLFLVEQKILYFSFVSFSKKKNIL